MIMPKHKTNCNWKKEGFISAHQRHGVDYGGKAQRNECELPVHIAEDQEAHHGPEVPPGYRHQCQLCSDPPPPSLLHILKVLQPTKAASSAGDWGFTHMGLWLAILIKIIRLVTVHGSFFCWVNLFPHNQDQGFSPFTVLVSLHLQCSSLVHSSSCRC